jgi:hypothetical protein
MHINAYLAIKAYFTINAYLFAYNPGKRTSGLAAFDMEVAKVCRYCRHRLVKFIQGASTKTLYPNIFFNHQLR